jgi:transcriptional regulator with XRE-family HTH domain
VPANPDDSLRSIGATIRAARLARGYTQQALARKAGVSRGNLVLLEQGGNVSIRYLLKLADVLELTDIPLGGDVQLTSGNQKGLNVFDLLESLDLIAALAEHLRGFAMNAVLPPSERGELKDTAVLKKLAAKHLSNPRGTEGPAKAFVQLSADAPEGASHSRIDEEQTPPRSSRHPRPRQRGELRR